MPKGVPYIVGNEAAERFSYYGMKAILFVFMTQYLMTSDGQSDAMTVPQARAAFSWFNTAAYFFPFVGAFIADALWGKYKTILYVSLLYCVGHAMLAMMDMPQGFLAATMEPRWFMYVGLALIAMGAGGIKPCVSANVGDQFGESNKHLLTKVFGWFYFAINAGSLLSTLATPWLLAEYGPGWAFGVPGVLMGIATFIFWLGRHKFVHIPPDRREFLREATSREGLRALGQLIPLYVFIAMFWSLYDQSAAAWVDQAKQMDRVVLGHEFLESQIQAVNPLLILLFIPLFTYVVYPVAERFVRVTPLRKIGVGFLLCAGAFALSAEIESWIQAGETPSIAWQILAYVILTAGEVLVSITGLEFSYRQAPRRLKSLVMGLFFLSVSAGNAFTALVNEFTQDEAGNSTLIGADYYHFFMWCMLGATAVYVVFSRFYKPKEYLQDEAPAT
jgi:proton-dependent oligopeptide transporter, POT family